MDMKMVMVIMQDEDVDVFLDTMARRGLRATKVSSTGGFLRRGNTTILIGVEADAVQGVLDIIRATCRTRKQPAGTLSTPVLGVVTAPADSATAVEVGGANIFVWDVEQYIRA